jgi:hypothetical protein
MDDTYGTNNKGYALYAMVVSSAGC